MEAESIYTEPLLFTRLENQSTKEIFGLIWSEYTRKINLQDAIKKTGRIKFTFLTLPLFLLKYVLISKYSIA